MNENLLLGTSEKPKQLSTSGWNGASTSSNGADLKLEVGQEYTYTVHLDSSDTQVSIEAICYYQEGTRSLTKNKEINVGETSSITFVVPEYTVRTDVHVYASYGNGATFSISNEKLEVGGNSTPWEPHPSEKPTEPPKPVVKKSITQYFYDISFSEAQKIVGDTNVYQILPLNADTPYPFVVINATSTSTNSLSKNYLFQKTEIDVDVWGDESQRKTVDDIANELINSLIQYGLDLNATSYRLTPDTSTNDVFWRATVALEFDDGSQK